jgi:transcriptional regulator
MYQPPYHALDDVQRMQAHITQHPLGAWVCTDDQGQLQANHIPFVLDSAAPGRGRLLGHVARANPVWQSLEPQGRPSVVMFLGAQAYISPSWYPGKTTHGEVVPTWNYVTVHVHGVARVRHDEAWKLDMLQRLTQAAERPQTAPWAVTDAPSAYIAQMLRAVVGVEIDIERLEGRLKVSQDEALADRQATVAALQQSTDSQARQMADLVKAAVCGG